MFIPAINADYLPNIHRYLLKAMNFTKQVESNFILAVAKLTVRYERQFDHEFYLRDKKRFCSGFLIFIAYCLPAEITRIWFLIRI